MTFRVNRLKEDGKSRRNNKNYPDICKDWGNTGKAFGEYSLLMLMVILSNNLYPLIDFRRDYALFMFQTLWTQGLFKRFAR